MNLRIASLILLAALHGALLAPAHAQTRAQGQQPATVEDDDAGSGFEPPETNGGEMGFSTAALVANMRLCGAGEPQLTAFYNREKRSGYSLYLNDPTFNSEFDKGFVLGTQHMQVAHQRGYAKPDQRMCQALAMRLNNTR